MSSVRSRNCGHGKSGKSDETPPAFERLESHSWLAKQGPCFRPLALSRTDNRIAQSPPGWAYPPPSQSRHGVAKSEHAGRSPELDYRFAIDSSTSPAGKQSRGD